MKNLSLSKSAITSLMAENTLTHQIGLTRINCAWIALNFLLNILMCHFVLQIRHRPNETNMNPYYGPNPKISDSPKNENTAIIGIIEKFPCR